MIIIFIIVLFPRICKAYCAIAFLYTKSVTPNTTALFPDLMSALAVSAEASNLESSATNKIVDALATYYLIAFYRSSSNVPFDFKDGIHSGIPCVKDKK
ncbi:hypothetical protein FWK45_07590 [Histophilus somni]|uniref:hypothetical protein n=1 Tax=Histophilus somni TaxID=731 RepID=UPI0011C2546C|nr:hypothetical protein [Histophilus somni]QEH12945.1 hypothetical protein FWK44_07560 [Histophilus somni]QEH51631.1 hypothetical protein FWK45_07590 [Histophilus somni]